MLASPSLPQVSIRSERIFQTHTHLPQGSICCAGLSTWIYETFVQVFSINDFHVNDVVGTREASFLEYAPVIIEHVTEILDHNESREPVAAEEARNFLLDTQIKTYPPVAQVIVTFLDTGFQTFLCNEVEESSLVEAILKDKKLILPYSAYLQGEYGLNDIYFCVPVKLGQDGAEEIIEISLTPEERTALEKSVALIRSTMIHLS